MPALSEILSEVSLFILTEIYLSVINEDINLTILSGKFVFINLYLIPLCHTESNAFSTSNTLFLGTDCT